MAVGDDIDDDDDEESMDASICLHRHWWGINDLIMFLCGSNTVHWKCKCSLQCSVHCKCSLQCCVHCKCSLQCLVQCECVQEMSILWWAPDKCRVDRVESQVIWGDERSLPGPPCLLPGGDQTNIFLSVKIQLRTERLVGYINIWDLDWPFIPGQYGSYCGGKWRERETGQNCQTGPSPQGASRHNLLWWEQSDGRAAPSLHWGPTRSLFILWGRWESGDIYDDIPSPFLHHCKRPLCISIYYTYLSSSITRDLILSVLVTNLWRGTRPCPFCSR